MFAIASKGTLNEDIADGVVLAFSDGEQLKKKLVLMIWAGFDEKSDDSIKVRAENYDGSAQDINPSFELNAMNLIQTYQISKVPLTYSVFGKISEIVCYIFSSFLKSVKVQLLGTQNYDIESAAKNKIPNCLKLNATRGKCFVSFQCFL